MLSRRDTSTFHLTQNIAYLLFLCLVATGIACAEKSADESAVEAISHPENIELSLWAESEQLANPVAFTFDNQGRMYLCETFRQSKGVEDNRGHMSWLDDDLAAQSVEDRLAYFKKHLGDDVNRYADEEDRITIIEDKDGDGKADDSWVFADGFNDIVAGTGAGVLVHDNQVYYTCIPDLWKITDKDGDGTPEKQQSLHYGYGVRVAFRGHDSHGLVLGPDGRLYFSIGDRGYNIRTDDGRHLKDPESGAIFRCELDGSGLEVFATGLRNPQELTFDDAGNLFTGDNNSDSGDMARWVHVVEGSETGWRMAFQYLSDRGPWNREKLWHPRHEGQAAYIVPPIRNFADGPSGLTYYPGTGFGDEYRGTFFLCDFRGDAAISGIRSFKMLPSGASFKMSEPRKFMWNVLATDVDFGPDGSLYTTDWIEGWEGVNRGRVVRATHPDHRESQKVEFVANFLKKDLAEVKSFQLTRRLGHDDRRVRMKAQMELAKRQAVNVLVNQLKKDRDMYVHLHSVWGLGHIARISDKPKRVKRIIGALPPLLKHDSAAVRAATATVMGDTRHPSFVADLIAATQDGDAMVRARAATALGKLASSQAIAPLVEMIAKNNDQDAVIRHAAVMGLVGSASEQELGDLATHQERSVRLAAVLALRRQKSEKLAGFLSDTDPYVVLEAARAIHDVPVPSAMSSLADVITHKFDSSVGSEANDALLRRVLNANFRQGTATAAERIGTAISMDVPDSVKLEAIAMLSSWGSPSNRDRVLGMWRPIEARSGEPAKNVVKALFAKGVLARVSPAVSVKAIECASNMGLTEITSTIRQLIANDETPPVQRANLLGSLSKLDDPQFANVLKAALGDSSPLVRSEARKLLVEVNKGAALRELANAVAAESTIERQSAFATLGDIDDERARSILVSQVGKLIAGSVPEDTRLDAFEAAKQAGLDNVLAPFKEQLESKPYGERHLAVRGGDADRGELVFKNNIALSCTRCHRVANSGGRVGPNLTLIGKEKTREYLLESIVDPNKEIAKGFGTLIVVTDDGLQHQGIVKQEAADLIHLVDANGKQEFISTEDIIARKNGKSAMPEDLVTKISLFELRDLVAYLASLKTPYDEASKHGE